MRFAVCVSVMRMCFSTPTLTGLPRGLFHLLCRRHCKSGLPLVQTSPRDLSQRLYPASIFLPNHPTSCGRFGLSSAAFSCGFWSFSAAFSCDGFDLTDAIRSFAFAR